MKTTSKLTNLMIMVLACLLCGCGGDDDDTPSANSGQSIADKLEGYWTITYNPGTKGDKNLKYQFISFNEKGYWAGFVGTDIFGSGPYLPDDEARTINVLEYFQGKDLTLKIKSLTSTDFVFEMDGKTYRASKDFTRMPLFVNSGLVGQNNKIYLGEDRASYYKEVFSNEYGGKRTLYYKDGKVYNQTFIYIYTGDMYYDMIFTCDKSGSIGGWNTSAGSVQIFTCYLRNDFLVRLKVSDYEY